MKAGVEGKPPQACDSAPRSSGQGLLARRSPPQTPRWEQAGLCTGAARGRGPLAGEDPRPVRILLH